MDEKKCPSCGGTKDGSHPYYCRKCNSARAKAWREANRERAKEWHEANKDHTRELVREFAARQHKAARAGHNAVSYFANRLLSGAKRRAKEKGIEIDIDKEWIMERLIRGTCEATGLQFAYEGRSEEYSRNPWQPSLDRIDNAKGYTKDNVQVVVWMFNQAKGEWTREQFMALVKALAKPLFKEAIESGRLKIAA